MEQTTFPKPHNHEVNVSSKSDEVALFQPGAELVYGLHGRCLVASLETRSVSGQAQLFYKLQKISNPLSRSTKADLAIWVPTDKAKEMGLRLPALGPEQLEKITAVLSSREYYHSPLEPWKTLHAKLETGIKLEGAIGLAKAFRFLLVYTKKTAIPAPEVSRLFEQVTRFLCREYADLLSTTTKTAEEKIIKLTRGKLLADH
jgi:RNA polymerase-interacting CarD/CdnL/TRCF family regulator